MKKVLFFALAMRVSLGAMAQRYTERSYDIVGLAEGDKVADALMKGIPCLIIGFLLAYFFTWQYANKTTEEKTKGSQSIGCVGMIIIGIGFVLLFPILVWVEAIVMSIVSVAIVIAILYFIYNAVSKKGQ